MLAARSSLFKLILALICLSPLTAFAGELRILDSMGLTRAVKFVDEHAKVVISTGSDAAGISLSHVDGLAPDIEGKRTSDKSILFADVPEGVWKIKISDQPVAISEVKIVQ